MVFRYKNRKYILFFPLDLMMFYRQNSFFSNKLYPHHTSTLIFFEDSYGFHFHAAVRHITIKGFIKLFNTYRRIDARQIIERTSEKYWTARPHAHSQSSWLLLVRAWFLLTCIMCFLSTHCKSSVGSTFKYPVGFFNSYLKTLHNLFLYSWS